MLIRCFLEHLFLQNTSGGCFFNMSKTIFTHLHFLMFNMMIATFSDHFCLYNYFQLKLPYFYQKYEQYPVSSIAKPSGLCDCEKIFFNDFIFFNDCTILARYFLVILEFGIRLSLCRSFVHLVFEIYRSILMGM